MRIELRTEIDEHEYAITLETDRTVPAREAMLIASNAVDSLITTSKEPF